MANNLISLVPQFNNEKLDYWNTFMKLCLESQDLWSVIEEEVTEEEDQLTELQRNVLKNKRQKDKKALFQIYQAFEILVYERISKAMSGQRAWKILQNNLFQPKLSEKKKVRLHSLRAYFKELEMKDNKKSFRGDEEILRSLSNKFDHVLITIEESQYISLISLESLQGRILQRSPLFFFKSSFEILNSTPNEAWYGKKPNVTHVKSFGYLAYSHIPDALRTKHDDKSEKCIFVGYSERSKAYKLYNLKNKKKIMNSRGVLFNKKRFLCFLRFGRFIKLGNS
ncbi:hypothetical protein ZIOFF_006230 [Zingiber officinale]|uniref:Retroviral polymerase SH3-like domain-containing protein n=1 Tax=Zingiber officinale TaxID=94328 RepID=A0A8J5LNB3_ZINOF|nr:hypothetical protein ZIOFF_006230 [Zingiber officinale]